MKSICGDAWDGDIDGDGTKNLFDHDSDGDGVCDATELLHGKDPADSSDNPSGLPPMVFGEVPVDHNWTLVELDKSFHSPVLVAGPLSLNGGHPGVVRTRNITSNSFEIRVQEYEYLDGKHVQETVSFLVMEMGNYILVDGTRIEASYFDTRAMYSDFDTIPFNSPFQTQPVVTTSITTFNDQRPVTGRIHNASTQGFDYSLQEEEDSALDHAQESVAYIAWEPSNGEIDGTRFEVATAQGITYASQPLKFKQKFDNIPNFLASMQTCNGGDTANLRHEKKSNSGLKLNVDEEQSLDNEMRHIAEDVGYIAFTDVQKKVVYAVNCGGDAYTDSSGVKYRADENFSYGRISGTHKDIKDTQDDPVYQSVRFGDFFYDIPVDNGDYEVTFQFAETYWSAPSRRVFHVIVQGQEIISSLDLVQTTGPRQAYQVTVPVTVSDGELQIEFAPEIDNAIVSGIVIRESTDLTEITNPGTDTSKGNNKDKENNSNKNDTGKPHKNPGEDQPPQNKPTATVTLTWDAPQDMSNIAGYNIYYAPADSNYTYQNSIAVADPTQLTGTISKLSPGQRYKFAATSFDSQGNESDHSDEVFYTVPQS
ncbi:MAG: malectin domain-containing carbohydrate-binding protein [Desulfovermiculus sp.]